MIWAHQERQSTLVLFYLLNQQDIIAMTVHQ